MGRVRHNSAVFRVHNREKPRLRPPRHRSLEKRVRWPDDADVLPGTRDAFYVPFLLLVDSAMWPASRIALDQYTRSMAALRENHARDRFDGRSDRAERDYARFVSRMLGCDVRTMYVRSRIRDSTARPRHARAYSRAVSRASSHPRAKSRCDSRSPAMA
jgi:hypothetical protein